MSDLESIYMQKNNNEESDLLSSYSKNKSSFFNNDNDINSAHYSTNHSSILDSIESKTPDSPLTSMFNEPPVEISTKQEMPEFLNEDNYSNDLNVRGSRYGNMSITDKMRGVQANRLNIESDNISLAEMYNDSSLDNRVAGGRYNVTISDVYSDERKWRALHGLNTDGKIEESENYQIDNEIVKAKEIQDQNKIEFENKLQAIKKENIVEIKPVEHNSISSLSAVPQSNNQISSLLNNSQPNNLTSSLLNNSQPNNLTSSLLNNDLQNTQTETTDLLNKYSSVANQATNNLMSDISKKDNSNSNKIDYINEALLNKKTNYSLDMGSNLLQGNPQINLSSELNNKEEDTDNLNESNNELLNKYSSIDQSSSASINNLMSDTVKKEIQLEDKLIDLTKNNNLSDIYFSDKLDLDLVNTGNKESIINSSENNNFIQYNQKDKEDLYLQDKLDLKNNKIKIMDNSLITETDLNIENMVATTGIVTTVVATKKIIKENFNEEDNLKTPSNKIEVFENSIFKDKVNSDSFDIDKYIKKRLSNKNYLSELTLSELINLKNELNELKLSELNENEIESIDLKLKEISREMIRKIF